MLRIAAAILHILPCFVHDRVLQKKSSFQDLGVGKGSLSKNPFVKWVEGNQRILLQNKCAKRMWAG